MSRPATGSVAPRSQFIQCAGGDTAGVSARGGQPVFASSTPAKAKSKAATPGREAAPSTRSATGDLWNGFQPEARSSVFAAEAASAGQGGGIGAPVAAALALGLGLAGMVGASVMFGLRRRRAEARATSRGSNTTER